MLLFSPALDWSLVTGHWWLVWFISKHIRNLTILPCYYIASSSPFRNFHQMSSTTGEEVRKPGPVGAHRRVLQILLVARTWTTSTKGTRRFYVRGGSLATDPFFQIKLSFLNSDSHCVYVFLPLLTRQQELFRSGSVQFSSSSVTHSESLVVSTVVLNEITD